MFWKDGDSFDSFYALQERQCLRTTMASVVASGNGDGFSANMLPRPQIGIERLQARRASNEPKEAMNCKSCRKRKVRLRLGVTLSLT